MSIKIYYYIFFLLIFMSCRAENENNIARAEHIFNDVIPLYATGQHSLFSEFYNNGGKENDFNNDTNKTTSSQKVAYLWPVSGTFAGVNALLKSTGDKKYLNYINNNLLPCIDNYYDSIRFPDSYQSYIISAGLSDRYYDDNVWLALDFIDFYQLSGNKKYLEKATNIWKFVMSGWSTEFGGGIYWCEQNKQTKNTCSNAPTVVMALKMYAITHDIQYLERGKLIYNWTKSTLQDPADFLYFDRISRTGKIDPTKFADNSGQMLQAACLLFKATKDEIYLNDAHRIAASSILYFTKDFVTPEGQTIKLFHKTANWFVAVLFRGYAELYSIDKNNTYLLIFRDNLNNAWLHAQTSNGFFTSDWSGYDADNNNMWLLNQSGMMELYASLGSLLKKTPQAPKGGVNY